MAAVETTDVAVIGGGMMGSAVALGLARSGFDVTVLDEGDTAFRAARGNFGLVWVQSKGVGSPAYARLSRHAAALWPAFARELEEESGVPLHFERHGGLSLMLDADELEAKRAMMAELGRVADPGLAYEIVDGEEARRRFPWIGPEVEAACYSPADGHLNPLHLLRALHAALARRGGRLATSRPVEAILRTRSGTFVVEGPGVRVEAARIVIAAGLGSARLGAMVGIEVLVAPRRGQVLVTARARRTLDVPTLTIRQTDAGSLMIGESWEDAGHDDRTTPAVLRALSRRAVRLIPALARLPVVRSWGALRIVTPDGLPVYEQSLTHPGAFAVSCHSGVTLAALHAGVLADDIAAGTLGPRFDDFSARRFHVH